MVDWKYSAELQACEEFLCEGDEGIRINVGGFGKLNDLYLTVIDCEPTDSHGSSMVKNEACIFMPKDHVENLILKLQEALKHME